MSDNLKTKTLDGVFWRGAEMFCVRFVSLFVSFILARLLEPKEFGLLAMLTIFIAIAGMFINSGFGTSLVQRKSITIKDESSVFYFNIVVAFAVYLILFVCAPIISRFYREEQLTLLLRVVALNLVLGSFGQVQTTLLQKQMEFKKLFRLGMLQSIVSGCVGVVMAYRGFGVWSLVASLISGTVARVSLLWFCTSWRPMMAFSLSALRSLFNFGSKIMFANLIATFFDNIYGLLIGKFYTPATLAFYNRGRSLPDMIVMTINGTITSVMFPAMATIQDNSERLKRGLRTSLTTISAILWPILIGLAVVADSFVHIVLTDKWLPAVPFIQIMCLTFALMPIHVLNLQVIMALGRSDAFLKLAVIKRTISIIVIIITLPIGVFAVAVGEFLCGILAAYLNTYYTRKLLNYSFVEQSVDLLPIGIATAFMALVSYAVGFYSFPSVYFELSVQVVIGAISYFLVCKIMRLEVLDHLIQLIQELFRRKFSVYSK